MTRDGALTRAAGPSLAMPEWAVLDDWEGQDLEPANPASWITREGLAEQREAVADIAFRRFHANQWVAGGQHWLPIGAWQACADPTAKIHPQERIYVGVDVGGERSASAVVWGHRGPASRLRGLHRQRGGTGVRSQGARAGRGLRGR